MPIFEEAGGVPWLRDLRERNYIEFTTYRSDSWFPIAKKHARNLKISRINELFLKIHIKEYAIITKPLYNLIKKATIFDFDAQHMKVFEVLKNKLIAYPILRLYNPKAETELHTDASAQDIAAILMQKQNTGLGASSLYSQAIN